MEHEKVNGTTFVSCKSANHFLTWYLGNYSNPTVNDFKHGLTKYTKKIPKRVLSRSMRVEIAYRQEYKFRNPSGLLAADYPAESDINLIIVTDFGEECDDEVTVALAPKTAQLVFTDKANFDELVSVYESFGGDKTRVHPIKNLWSLLKAEKRNVILQIGHRNRNTV